MAKTVTDSKLSEWKGLDRISQVVHEMPCIWREISKDDYGLDGEIEILVPKEDGKGYETNGGILKVQAKSGASYITGDTSEQFALKTTLADLEIWSRSNFPVLLIVFHPNDNRLYWKEVRTYVKGTPDVWRPPLKIVFSKKSDLFSPDSRLHLEAIASAGEPRVSRDSKERLVSNILPAKHMPTRVWSASCEHRAPDVFEMVDGQSPAFVIHENRLFTFADLSSPHNAFRAIIDRGDVEEHDAVDWWDDRDLFRLYVHLLNRVLSNHLRHLRVRYDRSKRYHYFEARHNREPRQENWYSVRTQRASVRQVAAHYEYGKHSFIRHDAARLSFLRIGSQWGLRIDPMYHFTTDGQKPWEGKAAQEFAIRKKALESNQHVLNHVLFWSSYLGRSRAKEHIEVGLSDDGSALIELERMPATGIADFAVPHDPAIYDPIEPNAQQLLLFSASSQLTEMESEVENED